MLILTRRPDEAVVMAEGTVEIRVLGVVGNQVKLGIKAPREMDVDREEIYVRKVRDKNQNSKK